MVEVEHGFIQLNLCFRDYLRVHENARLAYAVLKEQLLKDPAAYKKTDLSFTGYSLGKDEFIKNTLEQAGFVGFSINFCLHDNEWETYHRIREEQIFAPIQVAYGRFLSNGCNTKGEGFLKCMLVLVQKIFIENLAMLRCRLLILVFIKIMWI